MKVIVLSLLSTASIWAAPKLLPFQGHLTDAAGTAIGEDGGAVRVVQFKIYDAPVSGNAVWAGEVHKLSMNKGLVNTILGTKTAMADVDFGQTLYLEMTVDADGSQTITAADPPLLPRQVILPAVFAQEAETTRLVQGEVLLTETKKLKPNFISDGSIPAAAISADNKISANQLANNSVGTLELIGQVNASGVEVTAGAVTSAKIKEGEARDNTATSEKQFYRVEATVNGQ